MRWAVFQMLEGQLIGTSWSRGRQGVTSESAGVAGGQKCPTVESDRTRRAEGLILMGRGLRRPRWQRRGH